MDDTSLLTSKNNWRTMKIGLLLKYPTLHDENKIQQRKHEHQTLLSFPEQEVVTEGQMRVDSSGNNTKWLIMKAKRKMTGKYILTAENKHGEDSAEINLTVLGKFKCYIYHLIQH